MKKQFTSRGSETSVFPDRARHPTIPECEKKEDGQNA